MTLTERRKRIRQVKTALALAVDYTQPHLRDLDRSDQFVGYASLLLDKLVADLAEGKQE